MGYEVSLPSGAKMQVNAAPFSDSNRLLKVCAKELAALRLDPNMTDLDLYKNLLCTTIGSDAIEAAIWPCLRRCLYSGLKIETGTFEGEDARQDYLPAYAEIIKANVSPFLKGLSWKWSNDMAGIMNHVLKSQSTKTTT